MALLIYILNNCKQIVLIFFYLPSVLRNSAVAFNGALSPWSKNMRSHTCKIHLASKPWGTFGMWSEETKINLFDFVITNMLGDEKKTATQGKIPDPRCKIWWCIIDALGLFFVWCFRGCEKTWLYTLTGHFISTPV